MKTKYLLMALTASLMGSITCEAFSFMHFEPLVGYQMQTLKLVDNSGLNQEYKTDAPIYGAKFGFGVPSGITLDIVGTYSSGQAKSTPVIVQNPDFTHVVGSVQLGVSAMNIMKIYLGYIFNSDFEIQKNNIVSDLKLSGSGYQAGVVFYLWRSFALNLNYNVNQFKRITGTNYNTGNEVKTYYSSVDLSDASAVFSYTF